MAVHVLRVKSQKGTTILLHAALFKDEKPPKSNDLGQKLLLGVVVLVWAQ